jgi:hypothetical protein
MNIVLNFLSDGAVNTENISPMLGWLMNAEQAME